MRPTKCLAMVAILLTLSAGCKHEQEQLIRNAERESLSGPPRNIAWDFTNSTQNGLNGTPPD